MILNTNEEKILGFWDFNADAGNQTDFIRNLLDYYNLTEQIQVMAKEVALRSPCLQGLSAEEISYDFLLEHALDLAAYDCAIAIALQNYQMNEEDELYHYRLGVYYVPGMIRCFKDKFYKNNVFHDNTIGFYTIKGVTMLGYFAFTEPEAYAPYWQFLYWHKNQLLMCVPILGNCVNIEDEYPGFWQNFGVPLYLSSYPMTKIDRSRFDYARMKELAETYGCEAGEKGYLPDDMILGVLSDYFYEYIEYDKERIKKDVLTHLHVAGTDDEY